MEMNSIRCIANKARFGRRTADAINQSNQAHIAVHLV